MTRLICFAAISVMFADKPDLQAGLGLFVLFVSIWMHKTTAPYLIDALDYVEDASLIASWVTLYGGTLLFSARLGDGFNMVVTIVIAGVNLAFGAYILWVLAVPAVSKLQESSGIAAMAGRFGPLTTVFKLVTGGASGGGMGSGENFEGADDAQNGIEMLATFTGDDRRASRARKESRGTDEDIVEFHSNALAITPLTRLANKKNKEKKKKKERGLKSNRFNRF